MHVHTIKCCWFMVNTWNRREFVPLIKCSIFELVIGLSAQGGCVECLCECIGYNLV